MSTVNGFQVGSETLKYNYESLDNYNTPNFSTSSSETYAVGDYVMYNGKLYKCTTATTGGTWVSDNWTEAVLSDDVSDLTRQLSDVEDEIQIVKTVTGEVVFIPDAPAKKPVSAIVEIPYQSSGLSSFTMRWRRRNMLDLTGAISSAGITYTPQPDGTLKMNGTASGNSRYGFFGNTAYLNANNTYNLPAGAYTAFFYSETWAAYKQTLHVYKGTTTNKITDINNLQRFTNPTSQIARVANQDSAGSSLDNNITKAFLGVGACTLDDWDAPATSRYELSVPLGQTIYGGTVDLVNGIVTSKYASDGSELETPDVFSISVTVPTLYEGANTVWASIVGSVVTIGYAKSRFDNYDDIISEVQADIASVDTKADLALDRIEETYCSFAMFEKIGLIGDSYTTGSLYIPNGSGASYVGTYSNLSWGKNIQRLFGNTVKFYAHGGLSTKTWLTDATNGIAALEADATTSPCNLYWFGLGINDVSLYNANNSYLGALTDISEHETGTAWAATFYGNVGQIIERVQAASANSKIVICSFVGYRPRAQIAGDIALNNALQIIADYYGLPFINLKDDDFYMSDYYSGNILGKHPIAMLYSGMAMANARLFGKAVVDNQAYFKDYHMGTPIPDPEPDDPT